MSNETEWYGNKAIEAIDESSDRFMRRAAEFLVLKIKEEISIPFPPASDPYQPPHLRLGDLEESIGMRKIARGQYELGSSSIVSVFLELGTATMAPRPFFTRAIEANLSNAVAYAGG